ncbi:hypothetical protein [Sphingomonas sp.]|uniref:hypothetical protein n=1 Tax=Sphingomonas sp. TaxID=28214 RepID=UPI00183B6571|nr:hypothetical protein [Sphingomonas sp.]MBA3511119.1 hypothetical protein [Sphingomonas sp.]
MTKRLDWKAAFLAAIIAGIAFMMLEMALVKMLQGQSPWGPPRMMAAMVMGKEVLPPPGTFDATIMTVAMIIHMMLSVMLGVILGLLISRLTLHVLASVVLGAVFGVIVYYVNFYGFTALFPWFEMARGAISIFAHAVFGAILGGVYSAIALHDAAKIERDVAV